MKTPNQLREEFVQRYKPVVIHGGISFVSTLEEIADDWLDIIHQEREELVSEIEKMKIKKPFPSYIKESFLNQEEQDHKNQNEEKDRIYNKAIDAIIAHIKSKIE